MALLYQAGAADGGLEGCVGRRKLPAAAVIVMERVFSPYVIVSTATFDCLKLFLQL